VHIPSPHYPAVFDASGGARQVSLDGLYEYVPSNTSDAILAATYAGQVEALDRMVLATIDALSEPGRPRAIVIFSDHGSLTALGGEQERLSNFLAANTPGANELFGEEPSPVNLLRALFAHYLGEPTDPLPFHAYRTTEMTGLRFREVDIEGRD
jgi:hypothetical protein